MAKFLIFYVQPIFEIAIRRISYQHVNIHYDGTVLINQ